jgi:hypothetical protein
LRPATGSSSRVCRIRKMSAVGTRAFTVSTEANSTVRLRSMMNTAGLRSRLSLSDCKCPNPGSLVCSCRKGSRTATEAHAALSPISREGRPTRPSHSLRPSESLGSASHSPPTGGGRRVTNTRGRRAAPACVPPPDRKGAAVARLSPAIRMREQSVRVLEFFRSAFHPSTHPES